MQQEKSRILNIGNTKFWSHCHDLSWILLVNQHIRNCEKRATIINSHGSPSLLDQKFVCSDKNKKEKKREKKTNHQHYQSDWGDQSKTTRMWLLLIQTLKVTSQLLAEPVSTKNGLYHKNLCGSDDRASECKADPYIGWTPGTP